MQIKVREVFCFCNSKRGCFVPRLSHTSLRHRESKLLQCWLPPTEARALTHCKPSVRGVPKRGVLHMFNHQPTLHLPSSSHQALSIVAQHFRGAYLGTAISLADGAWVFRVWALLMKPKHLYPQRNVTNQYVNVSS